MSPRLERRISDGVLIAVTIGGKCRSVPGGHAPENSSQPCLSDGRCVRQVFRCRREQQRADDLAQDQQLVITTPCIDIRLAEAENQVRFRFLHSFAYCNLFTISLQLKGNRNRFLSTSHFLPIGSSDTMILSAAQFAHIRSVRRVHKPSGWYARGAWCWRS